MHLTDKVIRNAPSKARPYKLSDGDGLYLLVNSSGTKLWRLKYRFGGRENTLSIGKYPLVTLVDARDVRYQARKMLRENVDPNHNKRAAKREALFDKDNSFHAVALAWFNTNKKKWTEEYAKNKWRRLEIYALPEIGKTPIAKNQSA